MTDTDDLVERLRAHERGLAGMDQEPGEDGMICHSAFGYSPSPCLKCRAAAEIERLHLWRNRVIREYNMQASLIFPAIEEEEERMMADRSPGENKWGEA